MNNIITIKGVQRDEFGENAAIELVTVGKRYTKNDVDYITYSESEVSGMEGATTLIKVFADKVILIRMGNIEQKQEFTLGKKNSFVYATPYGHIPMNVYTNNLDISMQPLCGRIYIEYGLEINGQWHSDNTLSITVQEENSNGH